MVHVFTHIVFVFCRFSSLISLYAMQVCIVLSCLYMHVIELLYLSVPHCYNIIGRPVNGCMGSYRSRIAAEWVWERD